MILGTLAGLISAGTAYSQTHYSIADLGVFPGLVGSTATGINDRGDIVGSCVTSVNTPTGFILRDGVMKSIGKLQPSTYSMALSSNRSGNVAGAGDSKTPEPQALLFRNNSLINIAPNASNNVLAIYINDAGVMVGEVSPGRDGAAWIPQIWAEDPTKPGRFHATSLVPFPGYTFAYPTAANQSIQVVGSTANPSIGTRGVLWNNDLNHTPALLSTLPGDLDSWANGVSDAGAAVGASQYGIYRMSPVVWSADSIHTPVALPLLSGDVRGFATGINNSGQVIGYSGVDVAAQGITPVTWINGQISVLQSMLDVSGAGWQFTKVAGINNLGLIVGTGNHNGVERAFLLTPSLP